MSRPIADLLAEAEAIDAAATPGPWYSNINDLIGGQAVGTVNAPCSEERLADDIASLTLRDEDATFIARARSLVPELAAALKAVAAERDALKGALDAVRAPCDDEPGYYTRLLGEVEAVRNRSHGGASCCNNNCDCAEAVLYRVERLCAALQGTPSQAAEQP